VGEWRELGRVVRLQIQRSSLKLGERPHKYFDPAPLLEVPELWLTADGVAADAQGGTLDVHNAGHPASKNVRGINDISVGFTAGYARMRARFGPTISEGIAGENILVACDTLPTLDELQHGLRLVSADGGCIALGETSVAHPCVEFSRFALGDREAAPALVSETLRFLDDGTRGFYVTVDLSEPRRVAVGDRLEVARA
jgi:hypothetical protein